MLAWSMLRNTACLERTTTATSYRELRFIEEASLMDHTIKSPEPYYDAEPNGIVGASSGQVTTAASGTTSNEAAAAQSPLPQTPFLPCVLPRMSTKQEPRPLPRRQRSHRSQQKLPSRFAAPSSALSSAPTLLGSKGMGSLKRNS